MVRFIIQVLLFIIASSSAFTFHYGQIYYRFSYQIHRCSSKIYIPLWLDLLLIFPETPSIPYPNLHSTMVRFIIMLSFLQLHFDFLIYIPLWLDLLLHQFHIYAELFCNLHSTMVRFIILSWSCFVGNIPSFTFHYGQIYYIKTKIRIQVL